MAPSVVDASAAPPGYTSQRDGPSPLQSLGSRSNGTSEDLVSAQSHTELTPSTEGAPPFGLSTHGVHSGASTSRRYSSLPCGNSVTFPLQDPTFPLQNPHYHMHAVATSTSTAASELSNGYRSMAPNSQSTIRFIPTNYVSLSRKSTPHRRFLRLYRASASINGSFTVNPYLHIPAALLSPTSSGEIGPIRKNLKFDVENGGIDVNIFLVGEPLPDQTNNFPRTTLDLRIRGGTNDTFPLLAKIHTLSLLRPAFHLSASGVNGYVSLHLPPSFHGLVVITVAVGNIDAHLSLSRGFIDNATILSETSTTRSFFMGELGGWRRDKQGWDGDKADIGINAGKVRLQLLGEKDRDALRKLRWKIGGI